MSLNDKARYSDMYRDPTKKYVKDLATVAAASTAGVVGYMGVQGINNVAQAAKDTKTGIKNVKNTIAGKPKEAYTSIKTTPKFAKHVGIATGLGAAYLTYKGVKSLQEQAKQKYENSPLKRMATVVGSEG